MDSHKKWISLRGIRSGTVNNTFTGASALLLEGNSPMIRVLVLYPRGEGTHFNSDYWVSTHMPIVGSQWAEAKKWEADIAAPDSPYYAAAHIFFDSMEDANAALSSAEAGVVMGDVPNYTNTSPVISINTVSATS